MATAVDAEVGRLGAEHVGDLEQVEQQVGLAAALAAAGLAECARYLGGGRARQRVGDLLLEQEHRRRRGRDGHLLGDARAALLRSTRRGGRRRCAIGRPRCRERSDRPRHRDRDDNLKVTSNYSYMYLVQYLYSVVHVHDDATCFKK